MLHSASDTTSNRLATANLARLSRMGLPIRDICPVREFTYQQGCFTRSGAVVGGGLEPDGTPRFPSRPARTKSRPGSRKEDGAVGEPTTPQDRLPAAEEAFAERVAPLLELVERWRARIVGEAQGWPAVPLSGLDPDDPRRLAARIAEELLRAHGHLVAAEERVRDAAALRRRMRGQPDAEPGS